MINTIYSNLFEALQAALFVNVKQDLESFRKSGASLFKPITVIVPSPAVGERLKLSMAKNFGITAGVDFINIGKWLEPVIGLPVGMGVVGDSLQWAIWRILKDPDFEEALLSGSEAESGAKLQEYLKDKNDIDKLELAMHLAGCYVTYASYRLDWVLNWLGEEPQGEQERIRTQKDLDYLKKNKKENYGWEKRLWQELDKSGWEGIKILKNMRKNLANASDENTNLRKEGVHLFAPFSFAPAIFPFLHAVGGKNSSNTIWLYILNPSMEYWFDYVPENLFDWKKPVEDEVYRYLVGNAASTRAMADRFYAYLNGDFRDLLLAEVEKSDIQNKTGRRRKALPSLRHTQKIEVQPEIHQEEQMYFMDFGTDTSLHCAQSALLKLEKEQLPTDPIPGDRSIRFIKAPTPTREVENLVDLLHNLFKDQSLQPSDVLVVTPDIATYAPLVEAVFSSLPEEPDDLRLPYRIIGQSQMDENLTAKSISDLGDLLLGRVDMDALESWLEMPCVLEAQGLDYSDLTVIRNWLKAAGFRFGLTEAHLKDIGKPDDADFSLQQALKRLSLGFTLDQGTRRSLGEVLSVFGVEENGYDCVQDENGRVLFTLLHLAEGLEEVRCQIFQDGHPVEKRVREWGQFCSDLVAEFFPNAINESEGMSFLQEVRNVVRSAESVLSDMPVSFKVFWYSVKQHLKNSTVPLRRIDAVTFAPAQLARGVPFKVIIGIGFSEEGGFLGAQRMDELNLLGKNGRPDSELARRGDRDGRRDNRNLFVDLLLAAREKFYISYSIGTEPKQEKNPSPVVTDLQEFIGLNALAESRDKYNKLIDSMVVKIPLNRYAQKAFESDECRFWKSPRESELSAQLKALKSNHFGDIPPFMNYPIPAGKVSQRFEKDGFLPALQLIAFINDSIDWAHKKLAVQESVFDKGDCDYIAPPTGNKLLKTLRKREILSYLDAGLSREEILSQVGKDPRFGEKVLRLICLQEEINQIEIEFQSRKKFVEENQLIPFKPSLEWRRPNSASQRIKGLTDEWEGVYRKEGDDTIHVLEIPTSGTSFRKMMNRANIWRKAGKKVKVYQQTLTVEEEWSWEPVKNGPDLDESIEWMIQLLEVFLENGISYWTIDSSNYHGNLKFDHSPIYRGKEGYLEDLKNLSKDLEKNYKNMLKPNNDKYLEAEEEFCKCAEKIVSLSVEGPETDPEGVENE